MQNLHKCCFYTRFSTSALPLCCIPAHVAPYPVVVEQALDTSNSRHGNILIPELLLRKPHNVLFSDGSNHSLDLGRIHSSSCGDNLTANILSNGGGTIKRE